MIVLDTSVLVYAKGSEHPLRDSCRRLIAAAEHTLTATTTIEAIQEFVHVWARRRSREDAAAFGRSYAELLSPHLVVRRSDLEKGLELFAIREDLGAFDAVLAAAAIGAGATALVSADSDFAGLDGIEHVVPDEAGVTTLLERHAS